MKRKLSFPVSRIAAIGEDVAQPRVEATDRSQDKRPAVPVLDICGVHDKADQIALRVGDDVALTS